MAMLYLKSSSVKETTRPACENCGTWTKDGKPIVDGKCDYCDAMTAD